MIGYRTRLEHVTVFPLKQPPDNVPKIPPLRFPVLVVPTSKYISGIIPVQQKSQRHGEQLFQLLEPAPFKKKNKNKKAKKGTNTSAMWLCACYSYLRRPTTHPASPRVLIIHKIYHWNISTQGRWPGMDVALLSVPKSDVH